MKSILAPIASLLPPVTARPRCLTRAASPARMIPGRLMRHCLVATALLAASLATMGRPPEHIACHLDWFPGAQFAGLYVAEAKGFYRAANLDATLVRFAFGARSAEAIGASQPAALGCIEGYIFLQKRAKGADLRALAATLRESPAGYLSLAQHPVRSAHDFSGQRIGVHRYGDPLYHWFLRRAGMPETAATMVFVGDDLGPLLRGELVAMQGYATEELVRLRAQVGAQARFVSFRELGFDSYSEIMYTTPGQLASHGPAIQAFLQATRRGWREAFAHPEDTLAVLHARMGDKFDAARVRAALAALEPLVLDETGEALAPMSAAKWRAMEAACVEMGFTRAVEPPEKFLVPDLMP